MKIWCDACNNTEASIFCSADEAALCEDCDVRVHQANKLASKHQRFSLLQSSNAPHCDICQEKKALLFCQQDRAVLCRDCDISIHNANELTSKHDRFLLTGAELSSSTKNKEKSDSVLSKSLATKEPFISDFSQASIQQSDSITTIQSVSEEGGFVSSISEYLMEMLPGWQVEDLLDSSSDPVGFYKDGDDGGQLFLNTDLENNGLWVPEAPNGPNVVLEPSPGMNGVKGKVSRKGARKKMNDVFAVPQISPQSQASKRSRTICK